MIRPLLIAAVLSTLAACATTPAVPRSTVAVAPYRDKLELAGRIAINYSRDDKKESLNGKFTWQQTASATDVTLISPTGQTVALIKVTPSEATLQESDKPPRSAPNLDRLTQQTLGWTLPVSGLRDWLQGYATDREGKRFVASPANDNVITRDGWKLEYMSWQQPLPGEGKDAPPRPKRIDVTRIALGQPVDDMAIRIVIDAAQ